MKKIGVIDIETSGLLSDMIDFSGFPYKLKSGAKIWVVSVTDMSTMTTKSLVKEEISKESVSDILEGFDIIVAHNGLKFDFIALKLFGLIEYSIGYLGESDKLNGRDVRFIDSLIMSRFINPDRLGGHSLEAWGERVGVPKTNYRQELIDLGVIEPSLPKGDEFKFFHPLMVSYCEQDTITNAHVYVEILKEYKGYTTGKLGLQLEHKLADLAIRRESLGFWFDKDLAIKNIEELTQIMNEIQERVNPLLPPKPFNKTELNQYTPPNTQFKKDGTWSSHMIRFFEKHGITEYSHEEKWFKYNGNLYECPTDFAIKTSRPATVDDLDIVKTHLMNLGWEPSEWADRDLTRDNKKQPLPIDKRNKVIERYVRETLEGKFKEGRLRELGVSEDKLHAKLISETRGSKSFKVPTSPKIRVGVTKEMCPNLVSLGDTVDFAKDVADYYTYRHRKSAIAGGDIEDMDFDEEVPNTGYLSQYREVDGRIPTPAIELGAATHRYKHMVVANVPRASSLFGKEMRAMFGAGSDGVQFAYDFSSLEARVEGHYVFPYEGGKELAVQLLAEKPNDIHSITGIKMGIPRDQAKSVNYAILYGASAGKFVKMLGMTKKEAEEFYDNYWKSNPALKELKTDKDNEWIESGRKYIKSIDGRRINIRSQHSILNALFQSAGVILAKYINVLTAKNLEAKGYCIDVFKGKPDFAEMISYHDEVNYYANPKYLEFKTFNSKGSAQEFVDNWKGSQLGAIQNLKEGVWFVTLPSPISESIFSAIKEAEEMFSINVHLGIEIQTGRNWRDTH